MVACRGILTGLTKSTDHPSTGPSISGRRQCACRAMYATVVAFQQLLFHIPNTAIVSIYSKYASSHDPEGPSTQYLRFLAPAAIQGMGFWSPKPQKMGTWTLWAILGITFSGSENGELRPGDDSPASAEMETCPICLLAVLALAFFLFFFWSGDRRRLVNSLRRGYGFLSKCTLGASYSPPLCCQILNAAVVLYTSNIPRNDIINVLT